jgi:A/G-specific adenine glycosylase
MRDELNIESSFFSRKVYYFRKKLLLWYQEHGRAYPWRQSKLTDYEVTVSEILLQQTRADTVKRFYPRFIDLYPSWRSLSKTNMESLEQLLHPLGLSRHKARVLYELANHANENDGHLPGSRTELQSLLGIGHYTASVILNICHASPEPFLDTNMSRVLGRYFGSARQSDIRRDAQAHELARIVLPKNYVKEYNWAVLDLAALVCKARNPTHLNCPIKNKCSGFSTLEK